MICFTAARAFVRLEFAERGHTIPLLPLAATELNYVGRLSERVSERLRNGRRSFGVAPLRCCCCSCMKFTGSTVRPYEASQPASPSEPCCLCSTNNSVSRAVTLQDFGRLKHPRLKFQFNVTPAAKVGRRPSTGSVQPCTARDTVHPANLLSRLARKAELARKMGRHGMISQRVSRRRCSTVKTTLECVVWLRLVPR